MGRLKTQLSFIQTITVDAAETLINYAPTPDEIKAAEAYLARGGNFDDADKAEQFVLTVMPIPNMKELLMAHKFAMEFANEIDSIIFPLEKMLAACEGLRSAKKFVGILQVFLRVGNALNAQDYKGFRLTSLPKFAELTTATAPKRTMVQYVLEVFEIYENQKFL
eukprot:Gregarina_sp_Poly_1__185@NODE_1043_length_5264_cov_29_231672_g723_i0_p5_GENE_NODE_1043_length_5264_cov_29_231672_g723_i0NODE_1043_length_5264_cov_29_231672_g723_i0_p5_ORF_typecomplete_len165_score32_40FH2/PF02181_23/4_8e31Frankia_peptide/PF14407_6/0_015_NODE_1043_length_5264_cov_29_231672_g723_i08121306